MRHFVILGYWCVAVVVIALILVSFDYTFTHALFMGSLYLPALLCLRIMIPQVDFTNKIEGVRNSLFIAIGVIVLTTLLMLLANIEATAYPTCHVHDVMINPIFIALILTAISLPQIFIESWLSKKEKSQPQTIKFISDRHHISLIIDDIAFVESNDSEVWIHTLSGESHRTKTTITQWSSILDNGNFIRIHRAYIVNRLHITDSNSATLRIAENEFPISRKYRDYVRQTLSSAEEA